MKRFLFSSLFLIILFGTRAQNTCTQRLNQAEDDYTAGRLRGIPDRINGCLVSGGFTTEEEKRARKLLTLVYIFTDQEPEADRAMINLLKVDPEHQLDPQVDPAEIYFLYDQFRVDPIFRIGFRGGLNSSYVNVIQQRSVSTKAFPKFYNGRSSRELSGEESDLYTSDGGMGIGGYGEVLIERHLWRGLELTLGPQLRYTTYNVESSIYDFKPSANPEVILDVDLKNTQLYFRGPVTLRYTLWYDRRDKKILPYVFGGASYDYLLAANYKGFERTGGTSFTRGTGDLTAKDQVYKTNLSLIGGLGVKMRHKTNFFTAEIRYDNSTRIYTKGENAYLDQLTNFDGAFVEDDVSLDFISLSFGYILSIYKPIKLKKKE